MKLCTIMLAESTRYDPYGQAIGKQRTEGARDHTSRTTIRRGAVQIRQRSDDVHSVGEVWSELRCDFVWKVRRQPHLITMKSTTMNAWGRRRMVVAPVPWACQIFININNRRQRSHSRENGVSNKQ